MSSPPLSKKPAKLAALELQTLREEDKLTPDLVFRDPYLLDFLKLKEAYSEKDLENAILRELRETYPELGILEPFRKKIREENGGRMKKKFS